MDTVRGSARPALNGNDLVAPQANIEETQFRGPKTGSRFPARDSQERIMGDVERQEEGLYGGGRV